MNCNGMSILFQSFIRFENTPEPYSEHQERTRITESLFTYEIIWLYSMTSLHYFRHNLH